VWLQLMDRDPQMAQMLNNPELLRESLQVMSNPVSSLLDSCHATSLLTYLHGLGTTQAPTEQRLGASTA
jgi:hypothetical protein